jgi:hypothetical protein
VRSEVQTVMLPEDERELVRIITAEAGIVFVDGPKWDTPEPPIVSRLEACDSYLEYLLIWNQLEQPSLNADRHERDGAVWWYCRNEEVTIQFLRSRYHPGDPCVHDGRLAVATTQRGEQARPGQNVSAVERRYLALKRHIQKTYTNKVVIWQNRSLPSSRTNPTKPDVSLWVGPHALRWLEQDPKNRWVQGIPDAPARGYLIDLVSV